MFEAAISGLNDIFEKYPWVGELAGILPLTAFIDFIDFTKIHIFELTGGALPLWGWPVTPAGGRLLLSDKYMQKSCCLDREGRTQALMVADGRYGDQYALNNPETLKMCISSQSVHTIYNSHSNVSSDFVRAQDLEIILVSRTQPEHKFQRSVGWPGRLLGPWLALPHRHLFISIMGWLTLFGMIIMSGILQCFLSLAFLLVIPITGITIYCLYGRRPRILPLTPPSEYNRLSIITDPMNGMDCTVFYGESTLINSILNRPTEPVRAPLPRSISAFLRMLLRILIVGQWGLALGASTLKDWNAYFITFWIAFCIVSHTYLFSERTSVNHWMKTYAEIKLDRYQTKLSSRRALLNTVIALNPDTFSWDWNTGQDDRTKLSERGMKWLDRILAPNSGRAVWEEATRAAMNKAYQEYLYPSEILQSPAWKDGKGGALGQDWQILYGREYWGKFIVEGIYVAAKIREEAKLSGKKVSASI